MMVQAKHRLIGLDDIQLAGWFAQPVARIAVARRRRYAPGLAG
jgi:hypothetical protein